MSLFDNIVSAVTHQAGGQSNMLESVMGMINHPDVGGLSGLVQKLSQGGLSEQVASWGRYGPEPARIGRADPSLAGLIRPARHRREVWLQLRRCSRPALSPVASSD